MDKKYSVRFFKCHMCGHDWVDSPYKVSIEAISCPQCKGNTSLSIRDFESREDFNNSYKYGDVKELMKVYTLC